MNKDIRLATSFKGHRKRKKLKRILGIGAEVYLIDLWLTVAMDCPEGVLVGWDEDDIADACEWGGDPKELVDALIESHWLEKDSDGEYILHDWCEHQGWACNASARSEAARKNILLRWTLKEIKRKNIPEFKEWFKSEYAYQKGHTTIDILSYYKSYTDSIRIVYGNDTPYPLPSPLPSPSPTPTIKDPPNPPRGKLMSQKTMFKNYLKEKITGTSFVAYEKALCEFIDYRMSLTAKKKYQTEKGIDGLLSCVGDLIRANLDPVVSLKRCMEEEWLKPKPEYFKIGVTGANKKSRSDKNISACGNFIESMMKEDDFEK